MGNVIFYKGKKFTSGNTEYKVEQIGGVDTNANYEILLSGSADDTTHIEGTKKTSTLHYNPYTKSLLVKNGSLTVGSFDIADYGGITINKTDITLSSGWIGNETSLKTALGSIDPSGKVSKSGDTMTGDLTIGSTTVDRSLNIYQGSIYRKSPNVTIDTSSDNHVTADVGGGLYWQDSASYSYGRLRGVANVYGNTFVDIASYNKTTSGTEIENHIRAYANKDGTKTYDISDESNFRSALGLGTMATQSSSSYVLKTGDTMSGTLQFSNQTTNIIVPARSVTYIAGNQGNAGIYAKKTIDSDQWYPIMCMDTKSGGSWAIGNYNNEYLQFSYATKANRDSSTNSTSIVNLRNTAGTIALTSDLSSYLPLTGGTLTGNLKVGNLTLYSAGSNGGINSMLIGDDVTIGDCNAGGCFGMKSTGTNAGFKFYNSSGGSIGGLQSTNGTLQWLNSSGTAYNVAHTGNCATGDSNGQIKIGGTNYAVKGLSTGAYKAINCRIYAGTVVRSVTAGATATVFTYAQLNTLMGVSNSTYANTVVYACNGDYGSQNHRIYSVDCVPSGSRWDVRFGDNCQTGNYRFNYIVCYWG